MSVETLPMYFVCCDRCKVSAQEGGEFAGWTDDSQAIDEARDIGWLITDEGGHFCDSCIEWDDELDDFTPKGPE